MDAQIFMRNGSSGDEANYLILFYVIVEYGFDTLLEFMHQLEILKTGVIRDLKDTNLTSKIAIGWSVEIAHDIEDTKGYYLFYRNGKLGFDEWFLEFEDATSQLEYMGIKVDWNENQ